MTIRIPKAVALALALLLAAGAGVAGTLLLVENEDPVAPAEESAREAESPVSPEPSRETVAPPEAEQQAGSVTDLQLTMATENALFEAGATPTSVECGQNLSGADTDFGPDGWECAVGLDDVGTGNLLIFNLSVDEEGCFRTKDAGAEDFYSVDVADFEELYGTLEGCVPADGLGG